ncbi:MAG TPA: PRC-barrel domain-containing protein [Gammaproteobacteria bacterium]
MKSAWLFLAGLAPLTAAAVIQGERDPEQAAAPGRDAGNWNYRQLQDDTRLTDIFKHDVRSADGRHIGRVRDVSIGGDGNFDAVTVEFDQGTAGGGFALMKMAWSDMTLEQEEQAVVVGIGAAPANDAAPGAQQASFDSNGIPARQLIGMPVDLADRKSFGKVADVLVDDASRQPSALLVETGDGIYALPMIFTGDGGVAGQRVRYGLSEDAVLSLENFDVASRR